jgi:hypothetical protein
MSLEDYEPVAVRLDRWYKTELDAGFIPRILTTLLSAPGADVCMFRAELWRITQLADGAGERSTLLASGHAEEIRGQGNVNRTSHVENCETSAIGRALANWNQISHATLNGRPTREEMAKVQRYAGPSQSSSNPLTPTTVRGPMNGEASERQLGYIKGACKRDGIPAPVWINGLTKQQASDWIEKHKNGTPAQAINREMQSQVQEEDPF